jgi:SPP1 gp7 family putative phage head morphogenesis protein
MNFIDNIKSYFAKAETGTKTKLTKEDLQVIHRLTSEFKDRTRKNIQEWVQAKQSIDNEDMPRWAAMQDLFDYLKPDGHFGSQVGLRLAAARCTPYFIRDRKTKVVNDEKTAAIKTEWFFNMLADLLESALYKYTLLQFPNYKAGDMRYDKIPRRSYVPEKRVILKEVNGDIAYSIDDPAWADTFVLTESQSDYGIMDDIVKDLIWKKNSRESWAEFSEKFGIPLITATTTTRDSKEIARINAMLKAIGEAATGVLPNGSQITIHDSASKGDPFNTYLKSIELSNAEISKRIVGGTMVSDNGSSHSQGQTHERSFMMISEEDKIILEFVVNTQVLPKIKGYSEGDEFTFDRTERLSLAEQWKIVDGLLKNGAVIQPKWLSERFGIPVDEIVKITKDTTAPTNASANFNKASAAMAIATGAKGIVWPNYKSDCKKCAKAAEASWKDIPGLNELSQIILEHLWQGKDTAALQVEKALLTGGKLRDGLFEGWSSRRMEIDYNATDHRALAAMEYNLFHFSCTREKAGVLALNELLLNKEALKINSFNEFRDQAIPLLKDFDINHLRKEYNFAVATAQNAARYNQFKSEEKTVTSFVEYQTVGDDHVRPKHALLDGRVFSLSDNEAMKVWPPNDWGCRCEMLQFFGNSKSRLTTGTEAMKLVGWSDTQKKAFGVNRGAIGEVFLKNQEYVQDKGIATAINAMSFDKYGLKKFANMTTKFGKLVLDNTITKQNAKELFTKETGASFMGFEDYLGRKPILKEAVFTKHTTEDKYIKEERHKLFPFVKDVLTKPDEVYFFDYANKDFQTRYVKFYEDKAIVVSTKLGKLNIEINTWYEMKKDEAVRYGLLIKK